jgi:hypothetical protein
MSILIPRAPASVVYKSMPRDLEPDVQITKIGEYVTGTKSASLAALAPRRGCRTTIPPAVMDRNRRTNRKTLIEDRKPSGAALP